MAEPPSSEPPSSEPSEAMHRIRRIIDAGVVSVGDRVDFVITAVPGGDTFEYAAEIAADGRIIRPREVRASTPPPPDAKFSKLEFQSPSSFVRSMLQYASSRLPKNRKSKSVNGWVDCTIGGERLNDLFLQQLRRPKKNASSSPSGAGRDWKGSTPESSENRKDRTLMPKDTNMSSSVSKSDAKTDPDASVNRDILEKKHTSPLSDEKEPVKKDDGDVKSKKSGHADDVKSEQKSAKTSEPSNTVEKSEPNRVQGGEEKLKGDQKYSGSPEKSKAKKEEVKETGANAMDVSEDEPKPSMKTDKSSKPLDKSSLERESNEKSEPMENTKDSDSKNLAGKSTKESVDLKDDAKGDKKKEGNAKKSESKRGGKSENDQDMVDIPPEKAAKVDKKSDKRSIDVTEEEAAEDGEISSPPPTATEKVVDDSSDDQSKKKVAKSQKRKRSITPQSDVERSTRAKSRRRILDPAAAEAAAVAAAADKQEAISLRPTTRLTSGKIPKVVYNASPKAMTGDAGEGSGEEIQQQRTSSRRKESKRSSRRRAKMTSTEVSEDGVSLEQEELEEEFAERNHAVYLLSQLALAVRRTRSTTPRTIVTDLRGKAIDIEEAEGFLSEMLDNIRLVNASVGFKSEGEDMTDQMLAYIATELGRWKSGKPRPVSVLQRRKARLEQKRGTVEKLKRRGKRELDEVLNKLESEMEKRRTSEVETVKIKIQLNTKSLQLEREKQTLAAIEKEVKGLKMQEQDGRKRVEKTKRLFNELVEVAKKGAPGGGSGDGRNIGESVTSNDEEVGVAQTQTGNTPADAGRAAEVGRLRTLVRVRGAESEMWQRRCEKDCIKLRRLQEIKERLDNQLYRRRGRNVSRLLAAAAGGKKKNERGEKGRQANGGGQVGNGRSRGGGPTGVTKGSRKNSRRDEKGKRKAGRPAHS